MNRISFLKSILGKGLVVSVLPNELNNTNSNNFTNILIYSTFVAGFRYYDGQKYLSQLSARTPIDLLRESDNAHDSQAIAVYWGEVKLGFLPMSDNLVLAKLIDEGIGLYADITGTFPENDPWEMCEIGVYLPYPKELLKKSVWTYFPKTAFLLLLHQHLPVHQHRQKPIAQGGKFLVFLLNNLLKNNVRRH